MPFPSRSPARPGDAARGRAIVANRSVGLCLLCHSGPIPEERFQGTLAPSLAGAGARWSVGQLRLRIVDGARLNPDTIMPPYYRTDRPAAGRPRLRRQDHPDGRADRGRGRLSCDVERVEIRCRQRCRRDECHALSPSARSAPSARRLPRRRRTRQRLPLAPAHATPEAMAAAIKEVVGEAAIREGRVKLDLPPLVENGNTVPLTVSVESPMTAGRPRQGDPRLQREEPAAARLRRPPRAAQRQGAWSPRASSSAIRRRSSPSPRPARASSGAPAPT